MTLDDKGTSFAWAVILPSRRGASLNGTKPKGTLVISPDTTEEELWRLPVSVARVMEAKRASGEVHPASREELLGLLSEVSRRSASARIERLIDRREYTRQEVAQKLRLDGYDSSTVEDCLDRACAAGLVSNRRFADSFIRSKVASGWGMARIERELATRGIDATSVEGWPYDFLDPDDEVSRAVGVARTRRVSGAHAWERLVRYLCGRGFSLSVAKDAARQVLDE